jgi:DNA modification methylase
MSTKAQAQRIIASERKFGQPVPFLISPDFLLYDGHQRLSAWFTVYGADYEMDAMQSDRPLSEDEHKELVIVLHTGATGSWNWDALSGWSAGDLQEWGMNADALKGWNNDANNLKELLAAEVEPVDVEPQTDRAAELAEKWATASGQLWKLGDHRLLIGDCTVRENVERLMGGERADMVFTDPPYGDNHAGMVVDVNEKRVGKSIVTGIKTIESDKNLDFLLPCINAMGDFIKQNSTKMMFFKWKKWNEILDATSAWGYPSSVCVWDRKEIAAATFRFNPVHEFCFHWGNLQDKRDVSHLTNVWSFSRETDSKEMHPTVKPLAIISPAMSVCTSVNELIYEPFAGSGTTIIAAHNLNRRCFAMEISEKYGAVILERFFTATGITPELVE